MTKLTQLRRLTKAEIEATALSNNEFYLWDSDVRGFGLRVRRSGVRTFIFDYRPGGGRQTKKRRFKIGNYPDITVDQARTIARGLSGDVARGIDPGAARDKQRQFAIAEAKATAHTVEASERRLSYDTPPRSSEVGKNTSAA